MEEMEGGREVDEGQGRKKGGGVSVVVVGGGGELGTRWRNRNGNAEV